MRSHGEPSGGIRIYRLYREEGLAVRKRQARRKAIGTRAPTGEIPQVTTEAERTTINLISEANLTGYAVKEQKFIPSGGQYRAYVLLQYPLGSANRLLVDQVGKDAALQGQLRASKAFRELEEAFKKSE